MFDFRMFYGRAMEQQVDLSQTVAGSENLAAPKKNACESRLFERVLGFSEHPLTTNVGWMLLAQPQAQWKDSRREFVR